MSATPDIMTPDAVPSARRLRGDAAWSAVLALGSLGVHAGTGGLSRLAATDGENDSLLRLVQLRDLLAGQSWYDLHQYRMGLEGGFPMHWSRLVDAPMVAIMRLVGGLTGSAAAGETAALILWPTMLFAIALILIVRLARHASGDAAAMPALVLGAATLHSVGIFAPGAIDHHNIQLVLTLALTLLIVRGTTSTACALGAGVAAAGMIAIGMETAPHVATGGLAVALIFVFGAEEGRRLALGFGLGFAASAALFFAVTVPPPAWSAVACDAFSLGQGAVAVVAGLGMTLAARLAPAGGSPLSRALLLALLAAVLAGVLLTVAPECLQAPFRDMDPRLKRLWLDAISEAQSIVDIAAGKPASLARWYATPLLALGVTLWALRRGRPARAIWVPAGMLAAAFLVSLWQVRGAIFALPMAVVPLAGWVAALRQRLAATQKPSALLSLRVAAAWLLSFNLVWGLVAGAARAAFDGPGDPAQAPRARGVGACDRQPDLAALATLEPGTVAAISNLGAPILAFTPHRALAGPYHRNVAGNLAALEIWLAPPDEAHRAALASGADYLLFCPGNPETRFLARNAPAGLLAELVAGRLPAWLLPVAVRPVGDRGRDGPQIYRIAP